VNRLPGFKVPVEGKKMKKTQGKKGVSMIESLFRRRNKGRRVLDEVAGFATLVSGHVRLRGHFEGTDNCIVNGVVEGDCELTGMLVLGEQARWRGNIVAANAVISGEVNGNIATSEKLELTSSARVYGAISSAAIAIASGAIHEGEIHMDRGPEIVRFQEKRKSTVD